VIIERLAIEGEELPKARYSTALLLGEDLVTEDKLFENLSQVFHIGTSSACYQYARKLSHAGNTSAGLRYTP
jgi:hypothetical protein